MDHPAPTRIELPSWSSAAKLAWAVAAVELVLLVVAAVAIFAKPFADGVEKAAATEVAQAVAPASAKGKADKAAPRNLPAQTVPAAKLARNKTSVLVLNGNGRTGAASEASSVVRALNYLLAGAGNAPRTDFRRSLVMFRPGFKGEAYRLAKDVHVKRVIPLDGMKASALNGAHVVLILGG